ncbi:MAG: Ppx/GppA family phosphatase [candidate division Zixibacteria bacterium]|nr:Ppx/GppA family phosphatase [candidate division Zixibacteria bacterium]
MYSFTPLEKRIAIIDLGSNSARLMVAQYTPGQVFKITDEVSRRVRLGEGMAESGRLHAAAVIRAFDTLQMFRAFCRAQGIRRIVPVATAAVRDASNGEEFLAAIRKSTGLSFRVLTGEEEAYYGALGVLHSVGLSDGLVMDVGGGSIEISRIEANRFVKGTTLPFGAVRTTEAYLPGELPPSTDVARLRETVAAAFDNIDWMRLRKGGVLVGLGGTMRQLARIDRYLRGYPFGLINGYEIRLRRLENIVRRLETTPISQRTQHLPGLLEDRADIIFAGAMVIEGAMRRARASTLRISGQGLREGLFYEIFFKGHPAPSPGALRRFSVLNVARMYGYEAAHTEHVAHLALSLFDQLKQAHGYGEAEREYLWAAAMLHDIGTVVDYYDHHKHSAYIILSAGLPGYSHRETILIAEQCRYHRKGQPSDFPYAVLLRKDDGPRIAKLAALLRLAEFLDRSRAQTVRDVRIHLEGKRAFLMVIPRTPGAASVEIWEALLHADLFEQAYGVSLEIEEM